MSYTRSLNHFEFIFVYDVWEYSNFIDSHVAVQLSQHHLLERLSSPLTTGDKDLCFNTAFFFFSMKRSSYVLLCYV